VGQTINCIQRRIQQHWWGRNRVKDFFHLTLADDPDPMVLLPFVLEYIPHHLWEAVTPRRAGWRDEERRNFRRVATVRERHWVELLNSLYPHGWNSLYPGKPAAPHHAPIATRPLAADRTEARDVEAVNAAVHMWEADAATARAWLEGMSREDLAELLDGLRGVGSPKLSP
jgi:hypothetical protein